MKKANKGFTLVEVVLVMGLISVVIAVSYSIFFTGQKSFEVGIDKGIDQQESRIIREYLIKEFRYIAYLGTEKPDADKYYTLKIKETTQGSESRQLEKVQYKDSEEINREILPIKFNDLSMKIENGTMNVKLNTAGNNSDYNFTILMENDPTLSSQKFSMASDKIYYAYPEDILIADDESIEEPNEDE